MTLDNVKLNIKCVVKSVKIINEKFKIRLMELGLINGCEIKVIKKSAMKKTLLVIFNSTCFTLKVNLATMIEVEYA